MIELNRKIAARLFKEGISKEVFIEAVMSHNDSKLRLSSHLSEIEYESMSKAMNDVKMVIYKKYPEIQRFADRTLKCSNCEIEKQIRVINSWETKFVNGVEVINADTLENSFYAEPVEEIEGEGGGCDWVPYTVCLGLCAAGGPWLYWPCAYLCVRSWCK